MSPRVSYLLLGALLATSPCLVKAQTSLGDDGTYTIDGPSGPVVVGYGSTLNDGSQASITGSKGIQLGTGILNYGTVNLTGGQVVSAASTGDGILSYSLLSVSGGYIHGADSAVALAGSASAQISGGTFSAGPQSGEGNYGGWGLSGGNTLGNVSISNGTFQGGNGTNGADSGAGVQLEGNFTISGGTFQGGVSGAQGAGAAAVFLLQYGQTGNITGGNFSGGVFYEVQDHATLNISGGAYSSGMYITVNEVGSSGNFFGSALNWSGPAFYGSAYASEGILSGTLADGSLIDMPIYLSGADISVVETIGPKGEEISFVHLPPAVSGVPEPSSWLLLGFGVVGLAITGRRRTADRPQETASGRRRGQA